MTSGAGDGTETLVIRLCQRESASCGACCGVYNRRDFGRSAVRAELRRRTRSLSGLPRTPEAFQRAAAALAAEGPPPIFLSVHACPLFGYLDAAESRVGCLGHPAATGGIDLRDCGAYDSGTCDAFLCPSHAWLEEDEAALAEAACAGDSWLYGLVVTDPGYLRATLSAVADLAGSPIRLVDRLGLDPPLHLVRVRAGEPRDREDRRAGVAVSVPEDEGRVRHEQVEAGEADHRRPGAKAREPPEDRRSVELVPLLVERVLRSVERGAGPGRHPQHLAHRLARLGENPSSHRPERDEEHLGERRGRGQLRALVRGPRVGG